MTGTSLSTSPASTSPVNEAAQTAVLAQVSETSWLVIIFAVVWIVIGLVAAGFLSRRGHEFRPNAALGAVLGPIFIFLAYDMMRYRESEKPIVVSSARAKPGRSVLVVVVGDLDDPKSALAAVDSIDDAGPVTAAVPVEYEVEQRVHGMGETPPDSEELDELADLLSGLLPGQMMLPGRIEKSIPEGVREIGADLVLLVGSASATVAPGLETSLRARVIRVDTVTN